MSNWLNARSRLNLVLVVLPFLLLGCGGGSSPADTTPSEESPTTVAADAGKSQAIDAGSEVRIDGSNSTKGEGIVGYGWEQTAGTTVVLNNSDQAVAVFIAPNVPAQEKLTFRLTLTMKDGVSYTDSTEVNVAPMPKVWTSFADNFSEDEFYYVGDITALPGEPDKLYTGSEYSNGDVMFVDYTTGEVVARLPDGEAIAPNPSNSTHLVALTSPITGNGEIVESFDAGLNWATAAIQDDLPLLNGHHLQYTPDGAVLLLHSDSSGSRVSAGEVGIARSVDGGRNWSAPTGLATFSGVGPIATSASEPSKIFAISGAEHILRSLDYGASWNRLDSVRINCLGFSQIDVSPFDAKEVLLLSRWLDDPSKSCRLRLMKSEDGGDSWSEIHLPDLPDSNNAFAMCASPASQGLHYLATSYNTPDYKRVAVVLKSSDSGASWKSLNSYPNAGLPSTVSWDFDGYSVGNMACAASNDASGTIIYLSLNDGRGAYRYIDSGI